MASGFYNSAKGKMLDGTIDFDSDTLKVALYSDSFSFTASDTTYSTTNELATEGGYTQGGATLAGASVTAGATTKFDATDTQWTSATFTARFAVIYDSSKSNALVLCVDFGSNKSVTSGTFKIQWHTDGVFTLA